MATTFVANTTLATINCGECGGTYAIQERYREKKHEDGGCWNCPYCQCRWGYSGNSLNARLQRDLQEANNRIISERQRHDQTKADLRETELKRRAEKGAKTRIKNRVANGVCPCCNRSFKDLAAHMHTQHPEFATAD